MARFNEALSPPRPDTVNRAGGEAFSQSPELALVSLLLTSMVKNQFYRSADETVKETVDLVNAIDDKEFVAKAAVFARNEFGMRSISHVVAAVLGATVKGPAANKEATKGFGFWTDRFFYSVVRRPDDITEILSFFIANYAPKKARVGGAIPNAMRRGFARRLRRFDEYQLSKYAQSGKAVSLVDAVNICHPRYTDALTALMNGTLKSAETWDRKLSEGEGETTQDQKAEAWADIVSSGKIGYFAALRNIRNIMRDAPDVIEQLCQILTDENRIKKSLVLPFRYLSALKAVSGVYRSDPVAQRVFRALNQALDTSMENVPVFEGKTLVALDRSASMTWNPNKEGLTPNEIGSLFAAALAKRNFADVMTFGNGYEHEHYNASDSTLTIAAHFGRHRASEGTNFHLPFKRARDRYDRIIILSDSQGWVVDRYGSNLPTNSVKEYRRKYDVDTRIYMFDLQGYGDMQFPERNVYALAGLSEKVFDIMAALEQDRQALINRIREVKL